MLDASTFEPSYNFCLRVNGNLLKTKHSEMYLSTKVLAPGLIHSVPSPSPLFITFHLAPLEPRGALETVQVIIAVPHGVLPASLVHTRALMRLGCFLDVVADACPEIGHVLGAPLPHLVKCQPLAFVSSAGSEELALPADPVAIVSAPMP